MQCPPTPGPGNAARKPYGLVAAASVTSMGSNPSVPHTSLNSLANARVTARKMFSYSLVNSAASGELTR